MGQRLGLVLLQEAPAEAAEVRVQSLSNRLAVWGAQIARRSVPDEASLGMSVLAASIWLHKRRVGELRQDHDRYIELHPDLRWLEESEHPVVGQ
jgi:hypothetical protein